MLCWFAQARQGKNSRLPSRATTNIIVALRKTKNVHHLPERLRLGTHAIRGCVAVWARVSCRLPCALALEASHVSQLPPGAHGCRVVEHSRPAAGVRDSACARHAALALLAAAETPNHSPEGATGQVGTRVGTAHTQGSAVRYVQVTRPMHARPAARQRARGICSSEAQAPRRSAGACGVRRRGTPCANRVA